MPKKQVSISTYRTAFAVFWFGGAFLIAISLMPNSVPPITVGGVNFFLIAGIYFVLTALGVYLYKPKSIEW